MWEGKGRGQGGVGADPALPSSVVPKAALPWPGGMGGKSQQITAHQHGRGSNSCSFPLSALLPGGFGLCAQGSGRIFQLPCELWLPRQQLEPHSQSSAWGWVQVADLLCFPGRGKNKTLLLCSLLHLKRSSTFGYRAPNSPPGLDHQR